MTVSVLKGFEGKLYLGYDLVGRVSSFTVKVDGSVAAYYGIGSRDPTDIKEGNFTYTGTLERALINGTLFAHAIGYMDKSGGEPYTITKDNYCYPDTTITGELMPEGTVVYEAIHTPFIKGTVVVKRNTVAWGTENTDYIVDYANGLVTFAGALAEGYAWTLDYHYGRSFTLTGVLEVPGKSQRTDVTVTGLLFNNDSLKLNNTGETVMETLEFIASGLYGLATGEPVSGV